MAPNKVDGGTLSNIIALVGKTVYQVYEILKKTYGDNALRCSTVHRWHDTFVKEGKPSAELESRSGMPIIKLM